MSDSGSARLTTDHLVPRARVVVVIVERSKRLVGHQFVAKLTQLADRVLELFERALPRLRVAIARADVITIAAEQIDCSSNDNRQAILDGFVSERAVCGGKKIIIVRLGAIRRVL